MSTVTKDFETFCANLRMSNNVVENVQYRYHQITRRINLDFWRLDNNSYHSFYVGSYGRSTAIFTSDIDVVVVLPYEIYAQYNAYSNNGQSALLQAVSNS
jgi:UTP:GlnB (protein PII) uridylyltransferase